MRDLVLVTGASRGAGRAAALECAAAGFQVVAAVREPDQLVDLVKEAERRGHRISTEQLDVAAPSAPGKARDLVMKYGPFYGLVNATSVDVEGPFEQTRDEAVRQEFEVSVFGVMAITRALLPAMRAAQRGRVVNVTSPCARVGIPGLSALSAAMHAVRGWSESLRHELAPFGIDVCVVEPGRLLAGRDAPPMSARSLADEPAAYRTIREAVAKVVDRAGEDEEVGRLVAKVLRETSPAFRTTENPDASTLVALRTLLPDRVFASALKRWSGRAR